jgi:hypothetical protein
MTNALWWLVCMREALEPSKSENGGTVAAKPGYHSWGSRLPDHGVGDSRTDHSIRWTFDRTGPWWKAFTSAHDWTFRDAQAGKYDTIIKYTKRQIKAMKDRDDPRPDDVYVYVLGQIDKDRVVEGYNERRDDDETSGDITHLWHIHDSFRRNIIGSFMHMWQALTMDMGWTVAEWRASVRELEQMAKRQYEYLELTGKLPILLKGDSDSAQGGTAYVARAQKLLGVEADGEYGAGTAAKVKALTLEKGATRTDPNGNKIGEAEWRKLIGLWDPDL